MIAVAGLAVEVEVVRGMVRAGMGWVFWFCGILGSAVVVGTGL
jgi:hypothetical protein